MTFVLVAVVKNIRIVVENFLKNPNSVLCVWKVKEGGSNSTILSRDAGVCYGTAIQDNIKF